MFEARLQRQRHKLAAQFSQESGHSTQQIEQVLAAFPDPNKKSASPDGFFKAVVRSLIPKRGRADRHVRAALESVHADISSARPFNATYIGHELSESAIPAIVATVESVRRNGNTVAEEVSRAETKLEPEAIRGLLEIVGYDPDKGSGTFTSGGSMANMTALKVAQKLKAEEIRQENKARGEESKPIGKMAVLTTPFAHYSVAKACDTLGGSNQDIEVIKVGSEGLRMSPKDLEAELKKAKEKGLPVMAVVAIAGETETGLVDDLNAIADVTDAHGVRMMVDGAYGAPYRLSSKVGDKFKGMERAFAVVLDPHKAMYTPYGNGAVLFQDIEDHGVLGVVKAPYIGIGSSQDPETMTFEEKRREGVAAIREGKLGAKRLDGSMGTGSILSTIAVLRTLGKEGLGIVYDLTIDRINHLYEKVSNSSLLKPIHNPDLNLLCFTLSDSALEQLGIASNEALGEFVKSSRNELDRGTTGDGGYFFSETNLQLDEFNPDSTRKTRKSVWVYRACIMNPRTTNQIVDEAVSGLEEIIQRNIDERQGIVPKGKKRDRRL